MGEREPGWTKLMGVGNSEQKGYDWHAQRRVVSKFLQVAAVLAFGPDGHLGETHQGEEGHCGAKQGVREGGMACGGRA